MSLLSIIIIMGLTAVEDEELIRRARSASNEAIRNHDAEAVASFYTEDYSLVSSTNLTLTGKDANRESFAAHFENHRTLDPVCLLALGARFGRSRRMVEEGRGSFVFRDGPGSSR